MSDDDCDIFSAARKRAPVIALPSDSYNPSNDSFSKEVDYDFIDASPKKSGRTSKRKPLAASREKPQINDDDPSPPKQNKLNQAESGNDEEDVPRRALSPVSKLILEMEQKHVKNGDVQFVLDVEQNEAKKSDIVPVARRTRSSQSKLDTQPPPVEVSVVMPTKEKPKKRGRKKAASHTVISAESVPASVVSSSDSIVASFNSRRQTMAEIAARSKVLDSIDLVSAVAPRVEGFVNLDSDDEGEVPAPVDEANIFDNDNPTIEVALSWAGEIQIYKMRQHQKFKHMFKEVAARNEVDENDISVDMYYNFIGPDDTPHSIGLKSFHTLSGHATKSNNNSNKKMAAKDENNPQALSRKPKKFQLKVQADNWKHPMVMPMKKKDNFKMLYIKCAEELNCDARLIKLFFDGELLDPEDTPKNQDMEGNELIDLQIKS